jgi:DNA repair photolyase
MSEGVANELEASPIDPVNKLDCELHYADGSPKYKDAAGVIYGSPLVDIAADKTLVQETIKIVQMLLTATGWDIRLLSKSPLIVDIAKSLSPDQKKRVIFGLSTGTLDDKLARAIDPTCPSPSKRTEALRWLQDTRSVPGAAMASWNF